MTSTPLTNPQAAHKINNAKKRKVSSAKLSPHSWQGIPQYDGGGDCSFDSTIKEPLDNFTLFSDLIPKEEWFSDQDPSLETGEKTPNPAACIAEQGVESLGKRVLATGRATAGEPAAGELAARDPPYPPELTIFGPNPENMFNCIYCENNSMISSRIRRI